MHPLRRVLLLFLWLTFLTLIVFLALSFLRVAFVHLVAYHHADVSPPPPDLRTLYPPSALSSVYIPYGDPLQAIACNSNKTDQEVFSAALRMGVSIEVTSYRAGMCRDLKPLNPKAKR